MSRIKILLVLLCSVIVLSSCSRRYGHMMRRSSGSSQIVQKTSQKDYKERVQKQDAFNDVVLAEEIDVVVPKTDDQPQIIAPTKVEEAVNEVEFAISSKNGNQIASNAESSIPQFVSEAKGGKLVEKFAQRKLDKIQKKLGIEKPAQTKDNSGIIYIILVVILVLLILELIGKLFGPYFLGLLGLILLILLIGWLLGMWSF